MQCAPHNQVMFLVSLGQLLQSRVPGLTPNEGAI